MNEERITTVEMLPDGRKFEVRDDGTLVPVLSKPDWADFDALSEEDITRAALSDPDNPPLTDEELARMRPVPNLRKIRERLGMSQFEFAQAYELSLGTVQEWEEAFPAFPFWIQSFLRIIEQDPEGAREALARSYKKAS